MFSRINLGALAAIQGPERAFVSAYLATPDSLKNLEHRVKKIELLLDGNEDELTHFSESMQMVRDYLEDTKFTAQSMCVFACWANDFLQAHHLEQSVDDLLWIGAAPYIRPLAELQDEYENFVVVAADASESHVYFVTSTVPTEDERVKGDVKNRVKKGGWSQKRYARRRENELLHYADEVVEAIQDLEKRRTFDRIIFAGAEESMQAIRERLPQSLQDKVVDSIPLDLNDEENFWEQVFDIFEDEERESEETLWNRIHAEYMQGGRAAVGFEDVLKAATTGRVQKMIVTRDVCKAGTRCRDCSNVIAREAKQCPYCKSHDVFKVDLVEDLVRLLETSSAETEFSDPIDGLTKVGEVAALLRY